MPRFTTTDPLTGHGMREAEQPSTNSSAHALGRGNEWQFGVLMQVSDAHSVAHLFYWICYSISLVEYSCTGKCASKYRYGSNAAPLRIANRGDQTPAPPSGACVSDVEKLFRNQTHCASRQQQRIATPRVPATVKARTVAEEGRAGLVQSTSSLRNPLRCGRPTRDRLW